MKILYCGYKEHFYQHGDNYYSNGSIPDLIPALAIYFEKLYYFVPYRVGIVDGMRELKSPQQLEIVRLYKYNNKLLSSLQGYLWSFLHIKLFKKYIREVDVVVFAIPPTLPYIAFLPIIRKPIMALVAGDEQEVAMVSRSYSARFFKIIGFLKFKAFLERYLLRKSSAIICRNSKFKNKMVQLYNLDNLKIHIIFSGVNIAVFKPFSIKLKNNLRKEYNLNENDIIIGYVSTHISHQKGADILFDVYKKLTLNNFNIKLLLIGEDHFGMPRNNSIISIKAVKRDHLPKFYNCMDLFFFPSRSEGAPKVIMEALACGIPVVSTNIGGIPELITEETGFIADVSDIDYMTECCKRLIEDTELRNRMSKAARIYSTKHFNAEELVERFAKVILDNKIL